MKHDPTLPYFPLYFASLAVLAVTSWPVIRSKKTRADKKRWSNIFSIIVVVLIIAFTCHTLVLRGTLFAIPLVIVLGAVAGYININYSLYCESCMTRSMAPLRAAKPTHCRTCGHRYR